MTQLRVITEQVRWDSMTDKQVRDLWPCFSVTFKASDDTCVKDCMFRDRCLVALGRETIPAQQAMRGRQLSPAELATALSTDDQSITMAMKAARGVSPAQLGLPPQNTPEEQARRIREAEAAEAAGAELVDQLGKAAEPPPPKEPPTKAAPVKAPPPGKKPPGNVVQMKFEPPPQPPTPPASPAEDPEAFDRERERSTYVKGLKDGQVLRREWKGTQVEVRVDLAKKRYQVVAGPKTLTLSSSPTLYGLVKHLTSGPDAHTSAWSVKRFFDR